MITSNKPSNHLEELFREIKFIEENVPFAMRHYTKIINLMAIGTIIEITFIIFITIKYIF